MTEGGSLPPSSLLPVPSPLLPPPSSHVYLAVLLLLRCWSHFRKDPHPCSHKVNRPVGRREGGRSLLNVVWGLDAVGGLDVVWGLDVAWGSGCGGESGRGVGSGRAVGPWMLV